MADHKRPQRQKAAQTDEEEVESTSAKAREDKAALDDDIDAILDEIDDVLEENAEEFVRGFVQKGGQ